MVHRCDVLGLFGAMALACVWSVAATAQPAGKAPMLGSLSGGSVAGTKERELILSMEPSGTELISGGDDDEVFDEEDGEEEE